MTSEFDEFLVHSVTVEPLTGETGLGSSYAAPVVYGTVYVDEKRKLVRAQDASQILSEATIFDFDTTHLDGYAPGSKVLLPSGRTAEVIATALLSSLPDLPTHLEVSLT